MLAAISTDESNRDPLSEFPEQLVAALSEGLTATNQVQTAWDVTDGDGSLVQVKYLANRVRLVCVGKRAPGAPAPGRDW